MWRQLLILSVLVIITLAAPQAPQEEFKYEPFQYEYKVEDPEKQLFFDKNESGDGTGKVTGRYSVWLPDGRLMVVEYTVDKDTGYVPKITFQENANPLSG